MLEKYCQPGGYYMCLLFLINPLESDIPLALIFRPTHSQCQHNKQFIDHILCISPCIWCIYLVLCMFYRLCFYSCSSQCQVVLLSSNPLRLICLEQRVLLALILTIAVLVPKYLLPQCKSNLQSQASTVMPASQIQIVVLDRFYNPQISEFISLNSHWLVLGLSNSQIDPEVAGHQPHSIHDFRTLCMNINHPWQSNVCLSKKKT